MRANILSLVLTMIAVAIVVIQPSSPVVNTIAACTLLVAGCVLGIVGQRQVRAGLGIPAHSALAVAGSVVFLIMGLFCASLSRLDLPFFALLAIFSASAPYALPYPSPSSETCAGKPASPRRKSTKPFDGVEPRRPD